MKFNLIKKFHWILNIRANHGVRFHPSIPYNSTTEHAHTASSFLYMAFIHVRFFFLCLHFFFHVWTLTNGQLHSTCYFIQFDKFSTDAWRAGICIFHNTWQHHFSFVPAAKNEKENYKLRLITQHRANKTVLNAKI